MRAYLAGRLLALIPVLLVVAVVIFLLIRLTPGDPARVLAGEDATPEQLKLLRLDMGLEGPLLTQFARWVVRAVQGDLGRSLFSRLPVRRIIGQHIGPTLMLSGLAVTVALCIGIPLGVVSAVYRNSWWDQAGLALAMLGAAVPTFWLGLS
ncbi:MAG TPA: ABC transporter permease, partial [bacterium]|nr:ABC transporter permease [bacterium]